MQAVIQRDLDDWLDYQQRVHPRSIELGLDRVREVWRRMGAPSSAPVVITIGGTNGKGSTVAFLEAMLAASGKRVGSYTSPHLLRYNERIRVNGVEAGDAELIDAFERIENARGADSKEDVALTYFEFGTLAALWIFAQSAIDAALLEVGLGGRLDAVNIIDADASIVTTIDLDHQDWLGNDHDSIGREKAGIFRRDRPAVIGMLEPPDGLRLEATRIGANVLQAGVDYRFEPARAGVWRWHTQDIELDLPTPALAAQCQIDNAAAAIAVLHALRERLGWNVQALVAGMRSARAAARLQRFVKPGAAECVVDVGHNPQAASVLADWLGAESPRRRTLAVFGALADKDIPGIIAPLQPLVAQWLIGGLDGDTPRGLAPHELRARMSLVAPTIPLSEHRDIVTAMNAASDAAAETDRVLAFGSFFTAAAALAWLNANGYRESGA